MITTKNLLRCDEIITDFKVTGTNKLVKQRDELAELCKDLIESYEELAKEVNDTNELEKIEEFQEHLELLIDFDEKVSSDYS